MPRHPTIERLKDAVAGHCRRCSLCLFVLAPGLTAAEGTPAGTVVDNLATVSFDIAGEAGVVDSNLVTFNVLERLDVVAVLQSPQVAVASGETDASLLFTVTNTGNGEERFLLSINSVVAGDDFDPLPAVPAIYFDTDSSGDFSLGDVPYQPGSNDPLLAADASVDVLLVNDMPPGLTDGWLGRSELTATASSGTGLPGQTLPGVGDNGIDAVIGASTGQAAVFGEYRVADVEIDIRKAVSVTNPFGGTEPTAGATLTYTITVEVLSAGTASASVVRDPIPQFSTYVADSLTLNGANLSDVVDVDAGELDSSGQPTVVVRLGDLTQADGLQTVEFQVTID